jgi:tetratricopeptide (TPR) repeat protein
MKKRIKMKQLILLILILTHVNIFAQTKDVKKDSVKKHDKYLPSGNESYSKKKYIEAEQDFRISQSNALSGSKSAYNLGNSIYKQKHFSEAKYSYGKAIEKMKSKPEKHKIYHNLGNVFMKEKAYDKAVEAYKNALRNNPKDEQTRYNYALAKELLDKNPPKNNDKDKNKDKQDQDKKEQDKDKQDKDKEKQDQKDQPKPQDGNTDKQRMQNLLDAVNNEEKNVQEKVKAREVKGKPTKNEKDW